MCALLADLDDALVAAVDEAAEPTTDGHALVADAHAPPPIDGAPPIALAMEGPLLPDDGLGGGADPPIPLAPPRRRGRGESTAIVEGGRVTFYLSKLYYEAVCSNAAHGRCVLTRSRAKRPLGLLTAWLARGTCETRAEHWSWDNLHPPLHERSLRRTFLSATDGGEGLLAWELRDPGDDSEPEEAC